MDMLPLWRAWSERDLSAPAMATTGWFLLAARERASLLLTEWRSHASDSLSLFRLLLLLLLARERLRHVPGRAGAGESSGAEVVIQ